jgi:hypothetical protein
LAENLQDELLAHAQLLAKFGPHLGRPSVDTLKGSRHANMKELQFSWNQQVWRLALLSIPKGRRFCWSKATRGGKSAQVLQTLARHRR